MIVNYEKEMFNNFIEFFRKLLEGYMSNKEEDIFQFLMRKIKEEFEGSLDKILYSIQFLSFYHALDYVKKTKVNTKRENVFERLEEFRKILEEFLQSETFPIDIVDKSIYSTDVVKDERNYFFKFEMIYDDTENISKMFKKEVNRFLIKSIADIGSTLEKIGVLDGMRCAANIKARRHYLEKVSLEKGQPIVIDLKKEILDYFKEVKRPAFNPHTMYEVFSYQYLESLKTQELVFINLFWINKYAKMVENILYYATFFANRKTLLWGIKNGDVSKETLYHYLENDKGNERTEKVYFEFKKMYEEDYVSNEYAVDDIKAIWPIYELLAYSYTLKDLCFYSALETEGSDKSIKNFGLVEASMKNAYTYAYVWDLPHFNLPITIHCGKRNLIYYFKKIRKEDKIRLYLGYEDFFSKDNLWKNSFLYPISPEKTEYIKKKANLDSKQLKHVLFLQNGIWPEHLRDQNGKVSKRYISVSDIK